MKKVFVAQNPMEAQFVRGLLESHGIEAKVRGEALWGARGGAPLTPDTLPTVWVIDDSRVAEARQVLRDYRGSKPSSGADPGSWKCASCGEECEHQFTECWRCGASRGD